MRTFLRDELLCLCLACVAVCHSHAGRTLPGMTVGTVQGARYGLRHLLQQTTTTPTPSTPTSSSTPATPGGGSSTGFSLSDPYGTSTATCKAGTFESLQRTNEMFTFGCDRAYDDCSKTLILERSSDCKVKWRFGGGAPCTSGTATYASSSYSDTHYWNNVEASTGAGSTTFHSEKNEVHGDMPWGNYGGCMLTYVVPGWDNDKPVGDVQTPAKTLPEYCLKLGVDPNLCKYTSSAGAAPAAPLSPGAKAGVAVGVVGGLSVATAVGLTLANQLCGLRLNFACCKKAEVTVFGQKKDKGKTQHHGAGGGSTKPSPHSPPPDAAAAATPGTTSTAANGTTNGGVPLGVYPAMAPISGDLSNMNKDYIATQQGGNVVGVV